MVSVIKTIIPKIELRVWHDVISNFSAEVVEGLFSRAAQHWDACPDDEITFAESSSHFEELPENLKVSK